MQTRKSKKPSYTVHSDKTRFKVETPKNTYIIRKSDFIKYTVTAKKV